MNLINNCKCVCHMTTCLVNHMDGICPGYPTNCSQCPCLREPQEPKCTEICHGKHINHGEHCGTQVSEGTWKERLTVWIKTQHGTAGWEQKLENFIDEEIRKEVIDYLMKNYD